VTEEMTITGPVIGLDQSTDIARVDGRGTLTQMAERGLMTDRGLDRPKERSQSKEKPHAGTKRPLTVSWEDKMIFYGPGKPDQPDEVNTLRGQRVAKAEFYKNVHASMDDSRLYCTKLMETFMDRTVKLASANREAKPKDPNAPAEEAEPKPQIALLRCTEDVAILTRKLDPETGILLQQQRIEGDRAVYDKLTGNFFVPGPGNVWLWNREGEPGAAVVPGTAPSPGAPGVAGGRPIRPTSGPADSVGVNPRHATAVVGRRGDQVPANGRSGGVKAKSKPLPPLKLTVISFGKKMRGRYLTGQDGDAVEPRWADFFGDVQAVNAKVRDENVVLDFDHPPDDYVRLSAQSMRVISEPGPKPSDPARNYLKAWDGAQSRTLTETIQGDVITYDSQKELFYAYANPGNRVLIAQQASVGTTASYTGGTAVQYNRRSGEKQIADPSEFQIVDAKTGVRFQPWPDPKILPQKPVRTPFRLPGRTSNERRGFNGR
jgi:hypothetical protein